MAKGKTAVQTADAAREALKDLLGALRDLHGDALSERLSSVEELVWAVLADNDVDDDEARRIVLRMREAYVDWNEVRVERVAALARFLDPHERADELARHIRGLLSRMFDRCGRVDLADLVDLKPADARRALMEVEPVSRAVADRILMREVPEATMPFSSEALAVAKRRKLVPRSATRGHLNKLVAEALDEEEAQEFFFLLHYHLDQGCTKSRCPVCKK